MQANVGRIMGSRWYSGIDITGNSTTPTSFDTDIDYARENDLYLNTQNGNVYACTTGGDEETAKWVYNCNIAGPIAEIIDNLRTDVATKALSARQGMVLNNKILGGLYPTIVEPNVTEKSYILEATIRNVDGTIYVTSDTESISQSFVAIGVNETYQVSITLGIAAGFSEEGINLKSVEFSGGIHSISLKDDNGDVIFTQNFTIWSAINKALDQVKLDGYITDGSDTYHIADVKKDIDGTETDVFPITHAKAVWADKTNNITVADLLEDLSSVTNNTSTTSAISRNTSIPTMNTLSYALNRTTGIGSADTNYSTSMMRGISAGTSDLTAGSSALTSGAIYLVYQ